MDRNLLLMALVLVVGVALFGCQGQQPTFEPSSRGATQSTAAMEAQIASLEAQLASQAQKGEARTVAQVRRELTPALTTAAPTPTATPDIQATIAAPVPTATIDPTAALEVSIKEMLDLYESNEIAAKAKYISKVIRTRGVVDKIREGKFHLIPLDSDGRSASGAECHLTNDQLDRIVELRTGDEVVIVGRHDGFVGVINNTAKIIDCSILDISPSPTPVPTATPKPFPTSIYTLGSAVMVNNNEISSNCDGIVGLAIEEEVLTRLLKVALADDLVALKEMLLAREVFITQNCTSAKVIDTSSFYVQVRLQEGIHLNQAGWLPMEYVKAR